ncbi:MAG TPA: extracellular solute-binding protein [Euzebya sp.]|nr:extracellular solute-binding protein [Euzebya sp.]
MRRPMVALGLLLLVAACASGRTADDQVTLRVLMADDWADTGIVIDVVRAFERDHPGVEVALAPRPFNQILDDLQTDVAAGDPPDVVHQHVYAAAALDLAEPLDDLWEDGTLRREDYFPGAITDVSWGGGIYGVPLDINAMFLLLDADIAADLGIPETFDEVRAFAEEAVARGSRGMAIPASTWVTYGWVRANGGEYVQIDDDGQPSFTFDSPEVVQTLDFLGQLVADDLAYGPTARGVGADAVELFGGGDTAMLTTGTYAVAELEAGSDREFVSAPMPRGTTGSTQGSVLGGSSLLVGRGSPNRQLAIEFILALTDPGLEVALAEEEGRMPPRIASYQPPRFRAPAMDTLGEQLPTASPMLMDAFPAANEALSTAIEEILTGRADAGPSLRHAQAVAEASVSS